MHNVAFNNTDANWLAWGKLVESWIFSPPPHANRPKDISTLEAQMTSAGITGILLVGSPPPNPDPHRHVNVNTYNSAAPGPIVIPVPTDAMVNADKTFLGTLGNHTYPLPSFYSAIFGGSPGATLTPAMLLVMAQRRLGEYVINECM